MTTGRKPLSLIETRDAQDYLALGMSNSALVIANDAPLHIRDAAGRLKQIIGDRIQVCSGVADHLTIQKAIDAISSGRIAVSEGTFTISAAINMKSNVSLVGSGREATVIKLVTGSTLSGDMIGYTGTTINNAGIYDLTLDGNSAGTDVNGVHWHGSNNHFERLYIHDLKQGGSRSYGIYFDSNGNLYNTVKDCRFTNCYLGGVIFYLTGNNGNVVRDCVFLINSDMSVSQQCYGVSVVGNGNGIYDCFFDFSGVAWSGLTATNANAIVWQGNGNKAIGNYMYDCWVDGIYANGHKGVIADNTILTVNAVSGAAYGINTGDGIRNEIHGNYIEDCAGGYGMQVTGGLNSITANYISQNGASDSGITLGGGGGNTVTDNILESCGLYTIYGTAASDIIHHNTGYITEASGNETGTGAQQNIAHGLSFTPLWREIILGSGTAAAAPVHSAIPDATNIHVTATLNEPWSWATVGR